MEVVHDVEYFQDSKKSLFPLCSQSPPTPLAAGGHYSAFCHCGHNFSRISSKWSDVAYTLLCLMCFT